jgi:hypothetical protein
VKWATVLAEGKTASVDWRLCSSCISCVRRWAYNSSRNMGSAQVVTDVTNGSNSDPNPANKNDKITKSIKDWSATVIVSTKFLNFWKYSVIEEPPFLMVAN